MQNAINSIVGLIGQGLTMPLFSYAGGSVTILSLELGFIFLVVLFWLTRKFRRWFIRRVLSRAPLEKKTKKEILVVTRAILWAVGIATAVGISGVGHLLVLQVVSGQHEVVSIVDLKLFTLGKTPVTLWTVVYLLILSWLLVRLTSQLESWFVERVLARATMDSGMRAGMGAVFRYAVVTLGFIVIMQSAGIDLSTLTVLAGALGVAIGLGLQSMLSNVIGGFVILFERPIKVGDRIEVGNYNGDVTHVSLRATTIVTNDSIAVIVPNSEFVTSKVVNWTHTGRQCRFRIPVKIAPGADAALVRSVLLQCADEHGGVLKSPPPKVLFENFGDNSLIFSLLVWSRDYVTRAADLKSDLNFAIMDKCAQARIPLLPGETAPAQPPASTLASGPTQVPGSTSVSQNVPRSEKRRSA
jgi:small-conductance mechanosensitive channel